MWYPEATGKSCETDVEPHWFEFMGCLRSLSSGILQIRVGFVGLFAWKLRITGILRVLWDLWN